MSVVACKVYKDKIDIASDSIVVWYNTQSKGDNKEWSKLWQGNGLTVGCVGYCEEGSLFQLYCTTRKPKAATVDALTEFMVEFAEWKKAKTKEFKLDNANIIVFGDRAFTTDSFFINEITKYDAIGAGMDYALSALYLGHDVEKAVEEACELSIYCEKPIKKFSVKK